MGMLTRHGEEEGLDGAVAESLDDAGEEVLEGLGEDGEMLDKDEEVETVVFQAQLYTVPNRARVRFVGLVDVGHKTVRRKAALLFVQPFGGCWIVGKDEAGSHGDGDGDDTFDD